MKIKPSKLERYFAKYEFKAPYLLCCSDCESFSVEEMFALESGAEKEFKKFWLGYTETLGNPDLRREIAGLYRNSPAENVLVCAGAEEGIYLFMNTVIKPGDHMIVLSPAYQSLYEIAASRGCDVTELHLQASNGWEPDLDELAKSIRPQTKAIVVNLPHNPTGYLPSKEIYMKIIEIARTHNLYLFSDEVYRGLEYDAGAQLPAACDIYEKGVSLGVMSKAYGLAGLRIGWVVTGDKELFDAMAGYKDYTTICSSGPSEFFTTLALRHKEFILKRNMEIIQSNLILLDDFFLRHSERLEWVRPDAGPIGFPCLKTPFRTGEGQLIDNAEAFCRNLLEKTGILLLPGNMFNCLEPEQRLRIGFGRKKLAEILQKTDLYMSALLPA